MSTPAPACERKFSSYYVMLCNVGSMPAVQGIHIKRLLVIMIISYPARKWVAIV